MVRFGQLGIAGDDLVGGFLRLHVQGEVVDDVADRARVPGLRRAGQLAGFAQPQIRFGDREAVRRLLEHVQPFDLAGVVGRNQDAERLRDAAADAAAQLVQRREAVAVRVQHDHDRRVRDVDADFDDGGGDEHVGLAALETPHDRILFARRHTPVHEIDA